MKLRTVVNELACGALWPARPELLDANVLLTPEYGSTTPGDMLFVRLCRLEDWADGRVSAGERELLLVHAGPKIPADASPAGNVVLISHPSCYEDLRAQFLDLPSRIAVLELLRERVFNAFLGSYDVAQFARRSSEVLGNPVIVLNSDQRVLATAGEFPVDALDVQEVLAQGYISEMVNADMEADGIIEGVRRSHHSILAFSARYARSWVTSMVYFHHLEMGRFDVMEKDRPISGIDLELIDYASQLAGILIDRLGLAGERVGFGSSVLHDLVTGGFVNEETMRAQLGVTHLPRDGSYAMLTFSGQRDADRDYLARVGSMVGRAVRGCLWCIEDGVLCALVPVGRSEAVGYDDYARCVRRLSANSALASMLENNDLRAFVSEPFDEVDRAGARLEQCRLLMRVPDPRARGRVCYFWENRFGVLAAVAGTRERVDMMLDKRVVAMNAYDREHGTAYLETAIMSVRHPGSPAEAAAALSVHRNTYFYRMNKVKELFFVDLKDGEDRLALSFTAQVLEASRR